MRDFDRAADTSTGSLLCIRASASSAAPPAKGRSVILNNGRSVILNNVYKGMG